MGKKKTTQSFSQEKTMHTEKSYFTNLHDEESATKAQGESTWKVEKPSRQPQTKKKPS